MSPDRIERIAQPGQGAHWPICQCIALVESPRISTIKISELASLLHGKDRCNEMTRRGSNSLLLP